MGVRKQEPRDTEQEKNAFIVSTAIGSLIYGGFLIDWYIKNKDNTTNNDLLQKKMIFGIIFILFPALSLTLLILGRIILKNNGYVLFSFGLQAVNCIIMVTCLILKIY
jgi:hypothetical protein